MHRATVCVALFVLISFVQPDCPHVAAQTIRITPRSDRPKIVIGVPNTNSEAETDDADDANDAEPGKQAVESNPFGGQITISASGQSSGSANTKNAFDRLNAQLNAP